KNDIFDILLAIVKIDVLALDGVFDTGLCALLDVFGTANELAPESPPLQVRAVGLRRRVHTDRGLAVPVVPADGAEVPDVLVAPALGSKTPPALQAALERRDVQDAVTLIGERGAAGARLAGACTGTFLLAAAGVLDGQQATTTWWLAPLFR